MRVLPMPASPWMTAIARPLASTRRRSSWRTPHSVLREGLGTGSLADLDADVAGRLRRRLPWVRILFVPFLSLRRDVERVANISYGNAGRRNLLDVYCHRSHPAGCPTLIYLHGGAFRIGSKIRGARPLIYRLASQGWVCISANYRLGAASRFPDHLIDTKKVIAWVREHGHDYGADPTTVFLAGSSAGAHLASTAALTPNDPAFQPGFEGADTSVTAAISLGGYYGPISPGQPACSPLAHVRSDASPFFVVHGDRDTVVIADDARHFVERLQSTSAQAVVYAELPWGQHGFDFFHSVRFDAVVDAIDAFTGWVRSRAGQSTPGAQLPSAAE